MDPRTSSVNETGDEVIAPGPGMTRGPGADYTADGRLPNGSDDMVDDATTAGHQATHHVTLPGSKQHNAHEASNDSTDADDPNAIRQGIDHTRQDMSQTIDAIQERLSPQRLVNEAKETVRDATIGRVQDMASNIRDNASDAGNSMLDTIRQNPIPAAMAGIGLGWLIFRTMQNRPQQSQRRYYPEQPYAYQRNPYPYTFSDQAAYSAGRQQSYTVTPGMVTGGANTGNDQQGIGDRVSDAAQNVRDKAGDIAGQMGDRVGQITDQVQDRAGDLGDRMQSGVGQTRDWFGSMMQENPLVLGIAAVAVGAAAGFIIKETPQENRLLGETHDNLMHKAQDVAQDTAQKVQQVAKKAADSAKDEAQHQGLVKQS